ncbi:MAG TPA: O-antigen ligase family protein [Steroidobacteraceae bacterium]|jgi:O-antigen ligase
MSLTALAFLFFFMVGCVLAFVRHPIYGLITYVGVYYLHPPSRWWGQALPDLRWSLLVAVLTLLALMVSKHKGPPLPPAGRKLIAGLVVFVLWCLVQSLWALDPALHQELIVLVAKYTLLALLIIKCVDSERHLRLFLWSHVLGCLYLGWIVFQTYIGGRFEGFGGPDINEANAGALQIVTGIFVASSLFLASKWLGRAALLGGMPFIVNALVATMSRSGFLAAGVGGILFNLFTPLRERRRVRVLSVLAIILFAILTNPLYWLRMGSVTQAGEEVEGIDTGAGRLPLMQAQLRMFAQHPLGCGHRCTAVLSPNFLEDKYLTGSGEDRARASHNTFLSALVEQGVIGAVLYILLAVWIWKNIRELSRRLKGQEGFLPTLLPAVVAILGSIVVGDLFVDYLKSEVRIWFVAVVVVMLNLSSSTHDPQRHGVGGTAAAAR